MPSKKKQTTKKQKPDKNNRSHSDKIRAPEGIKRVAEYWEFVHYCALPSIYRMKVLGVETHAEFAKKYRVDEDTLTAWKKREDFWEEAIKIRRRFFIERSGNVLLGVEKEAIRSGNAASARLILEVTGEVKKEKDPTEHSSEALEKAIDIINRVLK